MNGRFFEVIPSLRQLNLPCGDNEYCGILLHGIPILHLLRWTNMFSGLNKITTDGAETLKINIWKLPVAVANPNTTQQ